MPQDDRKHSMPEDLQDITEWVGLYWRQWGAEGPPSWQALCSSFPEKVRQDWLSLELMDETIQLAPADTIGTDEETEKNAVSAQSPTIDALPVPRVGDGTDSILDSQYATLPVDPEGPTLASRRAAADENNARPGKAPHGLPPLPGYQMHRQIGSGGMGIVYEATDNSLNRRVAIKMVRGAGQYDSEQLDRFQSEAQAMAQLQHPGIVQVFGTGQWHGSPYIVCEYVQGMSLDDQLQGQPQTARDAAAAVEHIARSIHFAHEHGIVHRDLKPANVLVDGGGRLKVTDFGLAKRLESDDSHIKTRTGAIMGTPSYMSPEQAQGAGAGLSLATDVYALGAILYEMLTGRPPFRSNSIMETLKQVIDQSPAAPQTLNGEVPKDLETVCLKCLQKDPARRYGSAEELAEELARFLRGEPVRARPVGAVERTWRWARRNPRLASLSAAVLLLISVVAIGASTAAVWLRGANEETKQALNEALIAQRATESALQAETDAKQRAKQAVDNYIVTVGKSELLRDRSFQELRLELLSDALDYYQGLLDASSGELENDELADALQNLGYISSMTGNIEEAVRAYEQAVQVRRAQHRELPKDVEALENLTNALEGLAASLQDLNQRKAAIEIFKECVTCVELANDLESTDDRRQRIAVAHYNLALACQRDNRPDEAQHHFAVADEIGLVDGQEEMSPGDILLVANRRNAEGMSKLNAKRYQEAIAAFDEVLEVVSRLPKTDPNNNLLVLKGVAALNRGLCLGKLGRYQDARTSYDQAIAWLQSLYEANPQVDQYQVMLAAAQLGSGRASDRLDEWDRAIPKFSDAIDLLRERWTSKRTPKAARDLAEALEDMAGSVLEIGDEATAKELNQQASQLLVDVADPDAPDPNTAIRSAVLALNRSNKAIADELHQEAIDICDQSLPLLTKLPKGSSSQPVHFLIALLQSNRAKGMRGLKRWEEAESTFQRAYEEAMRSIEVKEKDGNQLHLARFNLLWKAQMQREQGKLEEAVQTIRDKRKDTPSNEARHLFEDGAEWLACAAAGGKLDPPHPQLDDWTNQGFQWLDEAAEAGLARSDKILDDERLDPFAEDPRWQAFCERLPEPSADDAK